MGLDEVLKEITKNGVKYVRLQFTDCYGVMRCRIVPAKQFEDKAKHGIRVLMVYLALDPLGDIPEEESGYGVERGLCDVTCVVDLDTFRILPWLKNTAGVITYPVIENAPLHGCPRNIAVRQLNELKELGFTLFSAHEYEFTVIDRKNNEPIMSDSSWGSCQRMLETGDFMEEVLDCITAVGIELDTIQGEHGKGQLEITYMPAFGIAAADNAILFKNVVKEVAWKHGLSASFMSRPHRKWATSSAHFNHSLFDGSGNKPVLYDQDGLHGLSKVAQHWIAGLLAHARAITIMMAPTINCIDRFHKDSTVPSTVTWGIDNRMSALRVKVNGEKGTYFENRLGAAGGDPYISLAATVAAGIDGIRKQLPLPKPLNGAKVIGENEISLPHSFDEALDCFLKDDVICKAFGEDFIRCFTAIKKNEKTKLQAALAEGHDEMEWARSFFFKYI